MARTHEVYGEWGLVGFVCLCVCVYAGVCQSVSVCVCIARPSGVTRLFTFVSFSLPGGGGVVEELRPTKLSSTP